MHPAENNVKIYPPLPRTLLEGILTAADYYDRSLIKDRMTGWLGDRLGFEFTPRGVPVDLVMTGDEFGSQYLGSYYLSENVRVDDNRLPLEKLKDWINRRVKWIDDNLDTLDQLMHRVRFTSDGEVTDSIFVQDGMYIPGIEDYPEKEGMVFIGWVDEDGNVVNAESRAYSDLLLTPEYIPEADATHGKDIAFRTAADIRRYSLHGNAYQIEYEVIPTDAQYKAVQWSSSDPDYASVDEEGKVIFGDPGDEPRTVTLTASLKYGSTREFRLTVTNGEIPLPDSISPVMSEIDLLPGEQSPYCLVTDPSPARINYCSYRSENEEIAAVDPGTGVITAVSPGQTVIEVDTYSYADYPSTEEKICTTSIIVKVSAPQCEHKTKKHVKLKKAADRKNGNIEYWKCSACGAYFSDPDGARQITAKQTVIPKNGLTVKSKKKQFTLRLKKKSTLKAVNLYSVKKNSTGKMTYKKARGSKKITVAKNGSITVKKGLKKGKIYKVKVIATCAATARYKAAAKTVTIKIRIR